MTQFNPEQAATELLKRRQNHLSSEPLAPSLTPTNLGQALAVQSQLIKLSDSQVSGWKCLLPIGPEQEILGPIFSSATFEQSPCPVVSTNGIAKIEPEIAFVFAKDLPAKSGGYTEQEIDDSIKSCHMALELLHNRFNQDVEFPQKLADCLVNQGLFIGPEISKEQAYNAAEIAIQISDGTTTQSFDGKHPNGLAQKPLYWLVNRLSELGIDIAKGQAMITGSYAGVVEIETNKEYSVSYQGIGEYSIEFSSANE